MKKLLVFAVSLFAGIASFAQTTWTSDATHAKLGFSITHLLVSDVEGSFKAFDSKIVSTKDDFSDAVIDLTADVNTVNTDNTDRDNHLKSPDFFDAAKFPTITFKSKSFKKVAGKNYKLIGDLTLHGVTKPIELDVVFNGTAVHPYNKKTIAGFKITGTLKRTDFNLAPTTPGAVLSDEVKVVSNIEFFKN